MHSKVFFTILCQRSYYNVYCVLYCLPSLTQRIFSAKMDLTMVFLVVVATVFGDIIWKEYNFFQSIQCQKYAPVCGLSLVWIVTCVSYKMANSTLSAVLQPLYINPIKIRKMVVTESCRGVWQKEPLRENFVPAESEHGNLHRITEFNFIIYVKLNGR